VSPELRVQVSPLIEFQKLDFPLIHFGTPDLAGQIGKASTAKNVRDFVGSSPTLGAPNFEGHNENQ
jgi:hypothetical protein